MGSLVIHAQVHTTSDVTCLLQEAGITTTQHTSIYLYTKLLCRKNAIHDSIVCVGLLLAYLQYEQTGLDIWVLTQLLREHA